MWHFHCAHLSECCSRLLEKLWAGAQLSTLWSDLQNVPAVTSACRSVNNRVLGSVHPARNEDWLRASSSPALGRRCAGTPCELRAAPLTQRRAGNEVPNYKQLLQIPNKCWGVTDAVALRHAQQRSVRRLGTFTVKEIGANGPAAAGAGALSSPRGAAALYVHRAPR